DELPRPGANRLPIMILAEILHRFRRHHHAGAVGQDQRQRRIRLLQLDRDLIWTTDLDRVERREVAFDVGTRIGAATIEVEFDSFGVEWRAVMKNDVLPEI